MKNGINHNQVTDSTRLGSTFYSTIKAFFTGCWQKHKRGGKSVARKRIRKFIIQLLTIELLKRKTLGATGNFTTLLNIMEINPRRSFVFNFHQAQQTGRNSWYNNSYCLCLHVYELLNTQNILLCINEYMTLIFVQSIRFQNMGLNLGLRHSRYPVMFS